MGNMLGERRGRDVLASQLDHITYNKTGFTARCPAHDDHKNSLSVTERADGVLLIKCHAGCETSAVLDVLGLRFADLFPRSVSDITYSYVDERGNLLYEVVRAPGKRFFQRRPDGMGGYIKGLGNTRRVLYRLDRIAAAMRIGLPVLLCEGEKDADAVNALGLEICATTVPMGAGKWQEGYTASLAGGKVFICPDNDKAGRGHLNVAGSALWAAGCSVFVADITKADPSLAAKKGADVSDYLQNAQDPAMALRRLIDTAYAYAPESAEPVTFEGTNAYILGEFLREAEQNALSPALSTGFPGLDAHLGGRMYVGLYVLGAGSGVGKTALAAQIAQNIAAQGNHVLFFSLEMSRAEMAARSLVHLLFRKDPARFGELRMRDLLYGGQYVEDIRAIADIPALRNLMFVEGAADMDASAIARAVLEHKRSFGQTPVVFVDYLQMLAPPGAKEGVGERSAVDANVLTLKRISREANIPVFVVSSFNRQNYTAMANYTAFKESGAIEYAADVVLALQARGISEIADSRAGDIERLSRDVNKQPLRALELVMLKNRRGEGFARIAMDFYAGNHYFLEYGR